MRLYAVCGLVDAVEALFAEPCNLDVVSWTILIQCYVKMAFPTLGVMAFFEMCKAKAKADEKTVVIVLSACSKLRDLSLGRKLHGYIRDNGVSSDVFVGDALIDRYLKCGDADSAENRP
nr:pentatricopeptide repeat-containing protein ELI1, chloroplastic-like [Ziziphus jujuba var. spinosa]